ncbi:MAG: Na+/H+ antiporter subunit E [Thiohalocapsa sp.]
MTTTTVPQTAGKSLVAVLAHLLLFSFLWIVLTGPDLSSWIIGLPSVALATAAAVKLSANTNDRPRLIGAIRFLPFFVLGSTRGGIDVASRVMRPVMQIDPGTRPYALRLKGRNAQVFFLDVISLLPGTLSADMRKGIVQVHALDINDDIDASLEQLETRVADLFGETLETADNG